MSNSNHYIIDTPLPLSQDFNGLKNEGLAFIQEHMGNEWTNLNPSDPGVTILEQVCYALTELGYCNDFSIQDLLTSKNGELDLADQFYQPAQILTTAPVTINDYRKYLVDAVAGVENAVLVKAADIDGLNSQQYSTYLLIDPAYNADSIPGICKAAHLCLNKSRNLGECFAVPQALLPAYFFVSGTIEIDKQSNLQSILQQVQDAVNNYIFPKVAAQGYYSTSSATIPLDEIFNGPLLDNGFILTDSLGIKKNKLLSIDIVPLISAVPGIVSVSDIAFYRNGANGTKVSCDPASVLSLDIPGSIKNGLLKIQVNGNAIAGVQMDASTPAIAWSPADEVGFVYGEQPVAGIALNKGLYRDINNYYSIQNTLPAVFAVGADGPPPNASDFQVAQSRQLKGYLTLMDQLLANQFSQTANINRLFSFKNTLTGAPADLIRFMHLQDPYEREHYKYPVPFLSFSPVYFYQSLYDVPQIRPLLKDNRTYDFNDDATQADVENDKSWTAYKLDPYNAYMYGLMKITEHDDCNLERRNNMLDHLLARHGESPLLVDAYTEQAVYSGTALQDKVIFKSLYLQNYASLSYNRVKGYDYQGANAIGTGKCSDDATVVGRRKILQQIFKDSTEADSIDFIINSGKINHIEKITAIDLINYSSVELKLSLLFGLKPLYFNFLSAAGESLSEECISQVNQALWLTTKRVGCIVIETELLLHTLEPEAGMERKGPFFTDGFLRNRVLFIFPGYIPRFKTNEFRASLYLFLDHEMPLTVTPALYIIDDHQLLQGIIDAYVCWHDSIRGAGDAAGKDQRQKNAGMLINSLKKCSSFLR